MSKTPEQMKDKMAGKANKLAGKLGDKDKQAEVAAKFGGDKEGEEQKE